MGLAVSEPVSCQGRQAGGQASEGLRRVFQSSQLGAREGPFSSRGTSTPTSL